LVAIVVIAVLMLLGPIIGNVFSTINSSLQST
jgi:Flp pilus assembly pilin Flp